MKSSISAETKELFGGTADVSGRSGREGGDLAQPQVGRRPEYSGQKRTGILRSSLNKSFVFPAGIK